MMITANNQKTLSQLIDAMFDAAGKKHSDSIENMHKARARLRTPKAPSKDGCSKIFMEILALSAENPGQSIDKSLDHIMMYKHEKFTPKDVDAINSIKKDIETVRYHSIQGEKNREIGIDNATKEAVDLIKKYIKHIEIHGVKTLKESQKIFTELKDLHENSSKYPARITWAVQVFVHPHPELSKQLDCVHDTLLAKEAHAEVDKTFKEFGIKP